MPPLEERPLCKCHGEPMRKNGTAANGRPGWCCRVKKREGNAAEFERQREHYNQRRKEHYEAAREQVCDALRERYDRDPIYRLEKLMKNARRRRRRQLNAMRERLEGLRGSL